MTETTEQFIDAAYAGDADAFVCPGSEAELGEPQDWDGLSAGEPGKFVPEYWEYRAPLDPA